MLRIFLLFFVICCVRAELHFGDPGVRNDILACNATFWKYDPSKDICIPKCKFGCGEGRCIRPNVCECDEPFIFRNKKCEQPKCYSPYCRNPICRYNSGNSHCKCSEGYEIKGNIYNCVPKCRACVNGECIAPDTCKCNSGYEIDAGTCKPVCSGCSNGECVAPGRCNCNFGYRNDVNGTCKPVCSDCSNGECVAPETCSCNGGYTNTDGKCKPICNNCDNGECVAPGDCRCTNGYEKINGLCKPKCDIGYKRSDSEECLPYCAKPCTNGFCSAPDTCSCDKEYQKDTHGVCSIPICSTQCINATCVKPDECECLVGHIKTSQFVCKPRCSCDNGKCIDSGPDRTICMCNKGYNMDNGTCKPVCSNRCVNGVCVEPERCLCEDGFSSNSTHQWLCAKPCVSCNNGSCNSRGECVCHPGYDNINNNCVPMVITCGDCESTCNDTACWCADGRRCEKIEKAMIDSEPTGLAGWQAIWLGGAIGAIVLVATLVFVFIHMWKKQQRIQSKENGDDKYVYGSVAYTVPGTLQTAPGATSVPNLYSEDTYEEEDEQANELMAANESEDL